MKLNLTLFFCVVLIIQAQGKKYSKCEFAQQLKNQGITNKKDLGTWTCIASHESGFDTRSINRQTGDYGILQISHLYWCSNTSQPGNGCHITCESLLGDDISEDIKCAKEIFAQTKKLKGNGFSAWVAYKKCKGKQTKWISGCKL